MTSAGDFNNRAKFTFRWVIQNHEVETWNAGKFSVLKCANFDLKCRKNRPTPGGRAPPKLAGELPTLSDPPSWIKRVGLSAGEE